MNRSGIAIVALLPIIVIVASGVPVTSQSAAPVDFARDIKPLLERRCVSCHGPDQQFNNFRLDRRSSVMRRGITVVPGSSETSRLYLRLTGTEFGSQMPPTGALPRAEIDLLKQWIDQGAAWPDAFANEVALPPRDAIATRAINAIRIGDDKTLWRELAASPQVINRRGPGGSTPLMYAALYGDAAMVGRLLQMGADPNLQNDIGATALMWALDDVETVRRLLDRGADVNAQMEDGSTVLAWAAGHTRSAPVVTLLLDRGATPNPARGGAPLTRAASLGSVDVIRVLLDRGAKGNLGAAIVAAAHAKCAECVALLRRQGDVAAPKNALAAVLPPQGDGDFASVSLLLDLGADAAVKDAKGRTALIMAASSDVISTRAIDALLGHGADPRASLPSGETALDFARLRGDTEAAALFTKLASPSRPTQVAQPHYRDDNTIDAAVRRSLPLLQRSAIRFSEKAGCVSCHHNSLTQMTLAVARTSGFAVDEPRSQQEVKTIAANLDDARERMILGLSGGAQLDGLSYELLGLAAERYPADANTDAAARGLRDIQQPDGRWLIAVHRPPLESSDIENTALSLRALQLYAPRAAKASYDIPIRLATTWLASATSETMEDRGFRLLGLAWGHAGPDAVQRAKRELTAEQRDDGGWAQLRRLPSDAYATGLALVALRAAGVEPSDPIYQRGVRFLLRTQHEDGSWYVKSRSLPIQPYFDSLFPHADDQWISMAATNWATMALAHARGARE